MVEEDWQKEAREELGDLFSAIGEFIYSFSQLEFTVRARLSVALELHGDLFDIVIGPYDFAILCKVTAETIKSLPDCDVDLAKKVDRVFNECMAFNQKNRITVAHGFWTTDGARHVSRSSLKASQHFGSPQELREMAAEARRLGGRVIKDTSPPRRE